MTTHPGEGQGRVAAPAARDWLRINLAIGALSFGGAGRMMLFQDAVIKKRAWLTEEEFFEILTIAQILPGPNLVNLSAALSHRLFPHSPWMAVAAVISLVSPGAVLAAGLAGTLLSLPIDRLLQGISLGSIALFLVFIGRMVPRAVLGAGIPRHRLPLALAVCAASLAGLPLSYTLGGGIFLALTLEFAWPA